MEEFDLKRFAKTAFSKKWFIIFIIIVSLVLGYMYSYIYNTPKYKSSTKIVLAQVSTSTEDAVTNSITQTDITMNQNLVDTYSDIIKSKTILKDVRENLSLEIDEDTLAKMISVTAGTNTEILTVEVVSEDAQFSQAVTNEIAKVFSQKVVEIYNINNVYILDEAEVENEPCNINHPKDMVIFGMLGIFVSAGMVLLVYMFDTTIKQEEDIEDNINMPVIGIVPLIENTESDKKDKKNATSGSKKRKEMKMMENIDLPTTEAFRTLRTNLTFGKKIHQLKNLLITSSYTSEGKSYISANLAIALARSNKKVLLIDADMRKGRQHKIFKVSNANGLANCLEEVRNMNLNNVTKYIKTTKIPNLHIITSGERPSNPSELISSNKMIKMLSILNEIYDMVIIDGTPSILVADSIALAKFVKNVVIVTAYKVTKIESLKKTKKAFENVGANVIGAILNKYPIEESAYGEKYYYSDEGTGRLQKDIKYEQRIQTVEELIGEVQSHSGKASNKDINALPKELEIDEDTNKLMNLQEEERGLDSQSNNFIYYKMENISQEINNIRNLFIQYAMNNKSVSKEELEEIKKEITSMKEIVESSHNTEVTKEIKEEVENIKEATAALMEEQQKNSEKIKKFIEDYRNKKSNF